MCAYMGRNTKLANREANSQKEGRWGPPGPSPLKQVTTIALQLVDDDLIVTPVVVDVSLVCTSSPVKNHSLLDEPVVGPIDYLHSINAEVVICEPLVLLDKVYPKILSPIDLIDDYLVVEPILPSNNLHPSHTTLVVAEKIDLFDKQHSELLVDNTITTRSFTYLVEDSIHQMRPLQTIQLKLMQ